MYHREYLLGSTIDNELVTCRIGLRDYLDKPNWLTISFSTYSIVPERMFPEMLKWRLEDMDKGDLYDLCWDYKCAPQELFGELRASDSFEDFISLDSCAGVYSVLIERGRWEVDEYYFQCDGCGQMDTQDMMEMYVDEEAYNFILDVWRRCHMSHVDNDTAQRIEGFISLLDSYDETEWIVDFIKGNNI